MAFMQAQVTNYRTWIEIDGTNGITFIDADDAPEVLSALQARETAGVPDEESLDRAAKYYDGDVQTVEVRKGYGARMSAPGYLDCTDWTVHDTEEQARAELTAMYGDDDDADGDDDQDGDDATQPAAINGACDDYQGHLKNYANCQNCGRELSEHAEGNRTEFTDEELSDDNLRFDGVSAVALSVLADHEESGKDWEMRASMLREAKTEARGKFF